MPATHPPGGSPGAVSHRPSRTAVTATALLSFALFSLLILSACTPGSSTPSPPPPQDPAPVDEPTGPPPRDRRILAVLGCESCHTLAGQGSPNAPPLDGVGAKYARLYGGVEGARRFFVNHVKDPELYPGVEKEHYPYVSMPHIRMSDAELEAVVEFLLEQR